MWFTIKFTDTHNYIFQAKNGSYNNSTVNWSYEIIKSGTKVNNIRDAVYVIFQKFCSRFKNHYFVERRQTASSKISSKI